MIEIYLKIYTRAGVVRRNVLTPSFVRWTDEVNSDMPITFSIHESDPSAELIDYYDIIEVMMRDVERGLVDGTNGFVSIYVGIVRRIYRSTNANGLTFLEYRCPGVNTILSWRRVAWPAGVNNRSTFSAVDAETILKTCVQYNCTTAATVANGRHREGNLATNMHAAISIAVNQARGSNVSLSFMGANLLDALQKVAARGGGDFALSWLGGDSYRFEFYESQLGDDKSTGSDRVLFSTENQTLLTPRRQCIGATATVAISAGRGTETDRAISIVESDDYASDNDIELFVNASNESTAAGRENRGESGLDGKGDKSILTFDIAQTQNQFYSPIDITGKKTYKPGDLVLVSYFGDEVKKIKSITAEWRTAQTESPFIVSAEMESV